MVRGPRVTAADRPWARWTEQSGTGEYYEQLQDEWRRLVNDLLGWRFGQRHPTVVRFARPRADGCLATTYVNPMSGNVEVLVDGGLITGLHDEIDPRSSVSDRWRFTQDVLAHELVHRAIIATGRPISEHIDHDRSYRLLADALAPRLGLAGFPPGDYWAWPYSGRDSAHYGGAWLPLAERDRHLKHQALLRDLADERNPA